MNQHEKDEGAERAAEPEDGARSRPLTRIAEIRNLACECENTYGSTPEIDHLVETEVPWLCDLIESVEKEVCLCAALLMEDGYIFRGHRHDDCYLTMGGYAKYTKVDGHAAKQGFLTSRGRFVTRKEAAELLGHSGTVLTSEDLY